MQIVLHVTTRTPALVRVSQKLRPKILDLRPKTPSKSQKLRPKTPSKSQKLRPIFLNQQQCKFGKQTNCLVLVNGLSPIRIAMLKIASINRHECYSLRETIHQYFHLVLCQ